MYSLHTKAISDVPVVCEYEDVFPEELPGLPPDRDVEFVINLVPGTALIAHSPYDRTAWQKLSRSCGRQS
jgi:hypothetical protein